MQQDIKKQYVEQHPYNKQLTIEEYKKKLLDHSYYLQHVFASVNVPTYEFLNYLNVCDCIEQNNTTLEEYKTIAQVNGYKHIFICYINDVLEAYNDKISIIEQEEKPHIKIYWYDVEQQQVKPIFNDWYISAIFGVLEHTPQQYIDHFLQYDNVKQSLPNDAQNDLKQLFMDMEHDFYIEKIPQYVQQNLFDYMEQLDNIQQTDAKTLFDKATNGFKQDIKNHPNDIEELTDILNDHLQIDAESYKRDYIEDIQTEIDYYITVKYDQLIESDTHQFFDLFISWYDAFENGHIVFNGLTDAPQYDCKSYYDYLKAFNDVRIKYDLPNMQHKLDMMPNDYVIQDNDQFLIDLDIIKNYEYYLHTNPNKNLPTYNIMVEHQKQYNAIKDQPQYFNALQRAILQQDIERLKDHIKEEQTKMDNCTITGTTEHYINTQVQRFVGAMHQATSNDVVKYDFNYMPTNGTTNYFNNTYLWHNLTDFADMMHNRIEIDVPYPNNTGTPIYLNYDVGGVIKEPINDFDKKVHDALCTLIEEHIQQYGVLDQNHPMLFNEERLHNKMYGGKESNKDRAQAITESLQKCNRINILIDCKEEFKKYYPNESMFDMEQPYMPVYRCIGVYRGNDVECWAITTLPPFYRYGKSKQQIGSYPKLWLSYGKSNTYDNWQLKNYIIQRIQVHRNKTPKERTQPLHILIDTMYKECKTVFESENRTTDKDKDKNKRLMTNLKSFLNDMVKNDAIKVGTLYTTITNGKPTIVKNKPFKGIYIEL